MSLSGSQWVLLLLLSSAVLWGIARTLAGARAARGWQMGARVLLNLALGGALAALLFGRTEDAVVPRTLWVYTAGDAVTANAATPPPASADAVQVRLPGATAADPRRIPVPDLATALRRFAPVRQVRVIGQGLAAHDRAALAGAGVPVQFDPAPLPAGVVGLQVPPVVLVGRTFTVRARWAQEPAPGAGSVEAELLSPGGQTVDRQRLSASGRILLRGSAPVAGRLDWTLRLRTVAEAAAKPRTLATVRLPIAVEPARPMRVQVLSGGPDPDLKYLRRWALDAGLELRSRVSLSAGIGMQGNTPPARLDAAGLDGLDLLIVDERSWAALAAAEREQVLAAVGRGLGLLLRLRGQPAAAVGALWATLGLSWQADPELPSAVSLRRRFDLPETAADLQRLRLRVAAPLATPLLADDRGQPLALAQPLGLGRIGALWLLDSFRLRLAGHPQAHADLWSALVEGLARPLAMAPPAWEAPPQVGQRAVVCASVSPTAAPVWQIRAGQTAAASAQAVSLIPILQPGTAPLACAAWWPQQEGWHRLDLAADAPGHWVAVRAADALPAERARADQATTLALTTVQPAPVPIVAATDLPWPRWAWFALVLLLCTALWTLERASPARSTP